MAEPSRRGELFDYFQAIRTNNLQYVKNILDQGKYPVDFKNAMYQTAAHIAACAGAAEIIELLCAYNADFNCFDEQGYTPLHIAAYNARFPGYLDTFKTLLKCGADPSLSTQQPRPPPSWAKGTELPFEPKLGWETAPPTIQDDLEEICKTISRDDAYIASLRQKYTFAASNAKVEVPDEKVTPIPKGTSVALFPGQGTQFVGMCSDVLATADGKKLFEAASKILGYDLAEICLIGPESKLTSTEISQPAVMIASLVALEKMRNENPETITKIGHMAGFSLGEYTALVASGALSFEDGVKLVKARAEAMQRAAEAHGGTMASIVGLDDSALEALIKDIKLQSPGILSVANYLFPKGRVVSGDMKLIDMLVEKAPTAGAMKATKLVVGGAFHTDAMQPAKKAIEETLAGIKLQLPRDILVYSNVTGKAYSSVQEMRDRLVEQCVSSVRWEGTVLELAKTEGPLFEIGPGEQLKAMVKRVDMKAWQRTSNVGHWQPPKKN